MAGAGDHCGLWPGCLTMSSNFLRLWNARMLIESPGKTCVCRSQVKLPVDRYAWLPAMTLAILPKCPLCIFSYSSAITMCSGTKIYQSASTGSFIFFWSVSLILICSFLLNWKGGRTILSIVLAAVGCSLVGLHLLLAFPSIAFYIGSFSLMMACFTNANMIFFIKRLKQLQTPEGRMWVRSYQR